MGDTVGRKRYALREKCIPTNRYVNANDATISHPGSTRKLRRVVVQTSDEPDEEESQNNTRFTRSQHQHMLHRNRTRTHIQTSDEPDEEESQNHQRPIRKCRTRAAQMIAHEAITRIPRGQVPRLPRNIALENRPARALWLTRYFFHLHLRHYFMYLCILSSPPLWDYKFFYLCAKTKIFQILRVWKRPSRSQISPTRTLQ